MRSYPSPSAALLSVAVAAIVGLSACAPATEAPTIGPASTPTDSSESPAPARTPAPSDGASGAPPAADSRVFGAFRRSALAVPADILEPAEALCRTRPVAPFAEEIGSQRLVVSDMRGQGVVILVFADDVGATGCRVELDGAGGMTASHFAVDADPPGELERGDVTLGALEFVDESRIQRVIAVGRVGDGTVRTSAAFADDTFVYASMANGWYAMWWAGSLKPIAIAAVNNRNIVVGSLAPP
jgi:hypothetical protein